jgi:hypothetical protein
VCCGALNVTVPVLSVLSNVTVPVLSVFDEVDVIGHQAISKNFDPRRLAALAHPLPINRIVRIAEECLHATIATLGDMVGNPWNDNAG